MRKISFIVKLLLSENKSKKHAKCDQMYSFESSSVYGELKKGPSL